MTDPKHKFSRSAIGPATARAAASKAGGALARLLGGSATVEATGRFLRKHFWVWPIIAALFLGGVGWWVNRSVEAALREEREEELTTLLNADIEGLNAWFGDQVSTADLMALDETIVPWVKDLLKKAEIADETERTRELIHAKAQTDLRKRIMPRLKVTGHVGFAIVSPDGLIVAADYDSPVGVQLPKNRFDFFGRVLGGETLVSKPYRSDFPIKDADGQPRTGLPTMITATSLKDDGKVYAVLGLRVQPDDEFTKILQVARWGKTGETYAFDSDGLLLSQSRFDDQLKRAGLLADRKDSQSILDVTLRDPGVDMTRGLRPKLPRDQQPFSENLVSALKDKKGANVDGYRDYRGVEVIGAWRWLDDANFGVATEVDVTEAFEPVYILRRAFGVLMGLLLLSALGIFAAMMFISRQQRALQKATQTARQLGQYALEEKLGEGGMGAVYRARHAMLRRPTAVKLLDTDKLTPAAALRFEREVQLTSGLTHPNTVAIFDYGTTPDGLFYYAMEYLDGLNLDELIRCHGALREGRAIYILRQVCGSLSEAHARGIVHRDVKPANIFLTTRGGLRDFVKVLDFGLVKILDNGADTNITATNAITGTPLYISPEAVQNTEQVDARSDVYGIGAVAYFLLTGSPPFTGNSVMDICLKHVRTEPETPSVRLGFVIDPALETLIMRCLAKKQDDRPANAAALLAALLELPCDWTPAKAEEWWAGRSGPAIGVGSEQSPTNISPTLEATVEQPATPSEVR